MENYSIDTYNTLMAIARALQSEENSERSPFIVVATDKSEASVAISGNIGHVLAMYAALTESLVESLKNQKSEYEILDLMSTIISLAVAKNFVNENISDESESYFDDDEELTF